LTVFSLLVFGVVSITGAQGVAGYEGWQHGGGLLIVGLGAVALAVALSREMVPGEHSMLGPARTLATVVSSIVLSICLLFPWRVEEQFAVIGWRCTELGLFYALPAVVLALLVLRRGTVLAEGAVGSLTGAFAGLAGVAILHFRCMLHTAPHLLVWHAGVPIACSAAGYLIGRYVAVIWPARKACRRVAAPRPPL
jgi:hypothetical protein